MQQQIQINPIDWGEQAPAVQALLNLFGQLDRTNQIELLPQLQRLIDWDTPFPTSPQYRSPYLWSGEGDRRAEPGAK
jgi:hypothetical protein